MIDFKDIFNSWVTSFNPTQEKLKHANDRFEVCVACEFKKEVLKNKKWSIICTECGCPIKKKIYSNAINPCPEKKWAEVDENHGMNTSKKKNNTLF